MADFNITFEDNLQFVFDDLTDYDTITGEDTSDLIVTYPPITSVDDISLNLVTENIATFGDSYTFVIANESSLGALTDGVYKFVLNILDSGSSILSTKTKYIINDYNVLSCLRTLIDAEIDENCSDRWCEIGHIAAMLDVAHKEAALDNFSAAQEIMDSLVDKCKTC